MIKAGMLGAVLVGLWLAACGSSDDGELSGTGGSTGGTAGSSSGGTTSGGGTTNTGGTTSGGGTTSTGGTTSGGGTTSTGGVAGSGGNTGGAAGSGGNTGGTAGADGGSTGGSAGTDGGNTGGTGGVKFINSGPCPSSAPTLSSSCNTAAICCYAAGADPFVCTAVSVSDGGVTLDASAQGQWKTIPNKSCCPASAPTVGSTCSTPGAVTCCYASSGFVCDTQPNPDSWKSASGC